MAQLLAPDTARYSINGTYLGRPAVTVLDFRYAVNDYPEGLPGLLDDFGKALADNWYDLVQQLISASYTCTGISYVDLSSADGPVGDVGGGNDHAFPYHGGAGGEPLAASTAMKVLKSGVRSRGSRGGAIFLPGAVEPQVNGNELIPAFVSAGTDVVGDFLEATTNTGILDQYFTQMCVIHTHLGVYSSSSLVTGLTLQSKLATQVRRLRG